MQTILYDYFIAEKYHVLCEESVWGDMWHVTDVIWTPVGGPQQHQAAPGNSNERWDMFQTSFKPLWEAPNNTKLLRKTRSKVRYVTDVIWTPVGGPYNSKLLGGNSNERWDVVIIGTPVGGPKLLWETLMIGEICDMLQMLLTPVGGPQQHKAAKGNWWKVRYVTCFRRHYTPRNEVIIPPATKLGGVYWNHPVRLSVRL